MSVNAPRVALPPTGPDAALARCSGPAWVIDPAKGRVLAANPAGAARLGLRPDAASGTLDAAMPGLVRLRALMREPLGGARREPLIFWTAYGAESLLCTVSALNEPASPPLALVCVAGAEEKHKAKAAATALKEAAAPSGEDAETLKKIARAIRTGFVAPAQTTADDDDEPDAAAEREAFSKLAHELKTPLSAIVVAAEIMKDQRFGAIANERYRGYTSDIHDNARHALAVINRILGDGRLEPAAGRAQAAELDLNMLAQSAVSAVRPLAEEAGLTLSGELHAQLPHVLADAMMVKQIVFNLLTNAVKFTKRGGVVRLVTGLGFDRSVFVAVQDTGPGMGADEIARALDVNTPPKPERGQEGGLGIGLPLASGLAKANGARIEIDSAPGEGTAVALIFPKDRLAAA
jgi:two-component system, cell cycle sensor histidine kinase PleC